METSFHGFFVGPASSSDAMDEAVRAVSSRAARVVDDGARGVWAVLERQASAVGVARALGDGTWVWEVELRNDFGDRDDDSDAETHSGSVRGSRWRAAAGELELCVEDEIAEEGFIRGGVMEHVALEYAQWYAEQEAEDDAPSQQREPASDPSGPAAELIAKLIDSGRLEVVNLHARTTLVEAIESCLEEPDDGEAALAILEVLEDAPEVVEIYADEAEIAALLGPR